MKISDHERYFYDKLHGLLASHFRLGFSAGEACGAPLLPPLNWSRSAWGETLRGSGSQRENVYITFCQAKGVHILTPQPIVGQATLKSRVRIICAAVGGRSLELNYWSAMVSGSITFDQVVVGQAQNEVIRSVLRAIIIIICFLSNDLIRVEIYRIVLSKVFKSHSRRLSLVGWATCLEVWVFYTIFLWEANLLAMIWWMSTLIKIKSPIKPTVETICCTCLRPLIEGQDLKWICDKAMTTMTMWSEW